MHDRGSRPEPRRRVRVKICGVNDPAGFEAAAEGGADWVGFNFFDRSPRWVSPSQASRLSTGVTGGPARVGLFVAPTDDDLARVLDAVALDVLQVYAPAARVAVIGARFGVPVWLPVGVSSSADLPQPDAALSAFVVEARAPAGSDRPGGNATRLDWSVLSGWQAGQDWLLAGGLTPANVGQAVAVSGATAVDVSSGVEHALGVKDAGAIRAFIAAARGG